MKLGAVPGLIPVPDDVDPIIGRIERSAELGLDCFNVSLRTLNLDPAYLEKAANVAARRGVDLVGFGTGANFYLTGSEADREIERITGIILTARKHLGTRIVGTPSGPMLTTHRWTAGLPLPERQEILAGNLRRLADNVASAGVTIALENHCDWRGHEIARIIAKADRPNLGVQIDTGNAYSVFEDPVECARALLPYIVSSHLKDVAVTPFATGEARGARAVGVPLGAGHTDNRAIISLIAERTPGGLDIPLLIEPFYLDPGTDIPAYVDTSVAWARAEIGPYLR
ncbi:MAG: sugar phosphate isomerase/epimerase [Chloroflexota bacterium]|nr:MAG: sugar phosphate isomerase/epimerase [Chloroflexota bacterium]